MGRHPSFSYGETTDFALPMGVPIPLLTPTNSGGAVATWTIHPTLPAGLSFNPTNGTISGTPTAVASATMYTVTASNALGQSAVTLTISVVADTLVYLGHASTITNLFFNGTNVFSEDASGQWVLWNYGSGVGLTSGDSHCNLTHYPDFPCGTAPLSALGGTTVAIETLAGYELRSITDGHLLATIAAPSPQRPWWKLAADGSYARGRRH